MVPSFQQMAFMALVVIAILFFSFWEYSKTTQKGKRQRETGMEERTSSSAVVVDIRMPFWSMVVFMVKWSLASIPALIILWIFVVLVLALLGIGLGGLFSFLQ